MRVAKSHSVTIRLSAETHATLQQATKLGPYELTITAVIERGIALASEELKRLARHAEEAA